MTNTHDHAAVRDRDGGPTGSTVAEPPNGSAPRDSDHPGRSAAAARAGGAAASALGHAARSFAPNRQVATRRTMVLGGLAGVGMLGGAAALGSTRPADLAPGPDAARATGGTDPTGRLLSADPGSLSGSAGALNGGVVGSGKVYSGFAEAAAASTPAGVGPLDVSDPMRNLLRKATFGYRPSDEKRLRDKGIDAWLSEQMDPGAVDEPGERVWGAFELAGASSRRIHSSTKKYSWTAMEQTIYGALGRQVFGDRQLFEVVVDVFHNHLHVPIPGEVWSTGPSYYADVIRQHAFGRYADMLHEAMRHPAMLFYLTNTESDAEHVNENLGRELLELHTVGLSAGYTEDDVLASARVLSGRTVDKDKQDTFLYDPERHYTGPVRILDWSSSNSSRSGGLEVGDEYIRYLASLPATARMISRKLAVRFVRDDPPEDLIETLAEAYLDNETAILPVLETLFRSTQFWESAGMKVKRPHEDLVSTARILDVQPGGDVREGLKHVSYMLKVAGQPVLGWEAPDGYPDIAAAWLNAGSLLGRWNVHRRMGYGWIKQLAWTPAEDFIDGGKSMTVGQYVDAVSVRLTGQRFEAKDRAAIVAASGYGSGTRIGNQMWRVSAAVLPLVLDSVYFQLR